MDRDLIGGKGAFGTVRREGPRLRAGPGSEWIQWRISSSWALKLLWMVTAAMKLDDCFLHKPMQCIRKQRHHLANKCLYSQGYSLSSSHVQMWDLDHSEGRVLKNWYFQTVVLLEDSGESLGQQGGQQSILQEISPEYSLEGSMLKLKLQYFGHLIWTTDSLEKTLMLGRVEGRRGRRWQTLRWLDGIAD